MAEKPEEFRRLYEGNGGSLIIIALAVIAFAIFIFITAAMNLSFPFWVYIAVPGLLLVIVILAIYFGSAKKTEGKVVGKGRLPTIVGIILLVGFVFAAYWPMIGPIESLVGLNGAKKTFGPEEFRSEAICSGGCQVDGTGVTLAYGGSIYLNGSENMSIRRILITPESLPEGTIIQTFIGPYEFLMTVQKKDYQGYIFLNGEDISDQPCNGCLPWRIGTEGVPIIIKTNKWDIFPFGWITEIPSMKMKREWYQEVFDTNELVNSYDKPAPVRGKVVIASVPGGGIVVKIKEVKIY